MPAAGDQMDAVIRERLHAEQGRMDKRLCPESEAVSDGPQAMSGRQITRSIIDKAGRLKD